MTTRRHLIGIGAAAALFLPLLALAPGLAQDARAPADAVLFESLEQVTDLAGRGPAILYFHADWCPTCQATMVSFQARWPEVQPGLTVIIADYDTETELKARYGVTYQNTFVQVAADGSRIQSWNGGGIEALNTRPIF